MTVGWWCWNDDNMMTIGWRYWKDGDCQQLWHHYNSLTMNAWLRLNGNSMIMTAWWRYDAFMNVTAWQQQHYNDEITMQWWWHSENGRTITMAWHGGIIALKWKRWNDDDGGMTTAWWSTMGRQLWNDDSMITMEWRRLHDEEGMMMMAWRQHICVGAHICTFAHHCSPGMPRFALYAVLVCTTSGTSQSCKTAAASTWKAGAKGDESFA